MNSRNWSWIASLASSEPALVGMVVHAPVEIGRRCSRPRRAIGGDTNRPLASGD